MERSESKPSDEPNTPPRQNDGRDDQIPAQPPVRPEAPPVAEEEMGGEAPCQLHRFWDEDE